MSGKGGGHWPLLCGLVQGYPSQGHSLSLLLGIRPPEIPLTRLVKMFRDALAMGLPDLGPVLQGSRE